MGYNILNYFLLMDTLRFFPILSLLQTIWKLFISMTPGNGMFSSMLQTFILRDTSEMVQDTCPSLLSFKFEENPFP